MDEWHYVKDGEFPTGKFVARYLDATGVESKIEGDAKWYLAGVEAYFKSNNVFAWKEIGE